VAGAATGFEAGWLPNDDARTLEAPAAVPDAPILSSAYPDVESVSMCWSAPASDGGSPVTEYRIYRGVDSGAKTLIHMSAPTPRCYMDTAVVGGTTYSYEVSAVNADGEGPRSNEESATPLPATVPDAPTLLPANAGNGTVHLHWDNAGDGGRPITSFSIYRGTASGSGKAFFGTVGADDRDYTDSAVTNGTTYFYDVRAVNEIGESEPSTEQSALPVGEPAAPTLDSAAAGDGTVELSWSAPSDGGSPITEYKVFRGIGGGTRTQLTTVDGGELSYTDTAVQNGTAYRYDVVAVNAIGDSLHSNDVEALPLGPPDAPVLDLPVAGDGTVVLTWSAPPFGGGTAVTAYRVYRGTGGEKAVIATIDPPELAYTDTTAANGTTYFYEVAAVNAIGEGEHSVERSAKPQRKPDAPVFAEPVEGDETITLDWSVAFDGGSPVTGYTLFRTAPGGVETPIALGPGTTFTDTNLTNGDTYEYEVVATNEVGDSPRSGPVTASPRTVPEAPHLDTAVAGLLKVTLTWSKPSDDGGRPIIGYRIYRTANGNESTLQSLNAFTFEDTTGATGVTYSYTVAAYNEVGEGPRSNSLSKAAEGPPAAPALASAVAGDANVKLTWTPPTNTGALSITGYKIYRGPLNGSLTELLQLPAGATNYTDGGLVNGTTYSYAVSAVNSAGEGPKSVTGNATPATIPGAPTLDSATAGIGSVALAWSPPGSNGGSAISNYRIYRGTSSGNETLLTTVGAVTGFTDAGLEPGTTYFYEVAAVNAVDDGPTSGELSATTPNVPVAPVLGTATPSGKESVALTWSPPASDGGRPVPGYKLWRGNSSGNNTALATVGAVTSFTDTNVVDSRTYYYKVSALNAVGVSPRSNELPTFVPTGPGVPTLEPAEAGNASVTLHWAPPADGGGSAITAYKVFRTGPFGSEALLATLGPVTQYTDNLVANDKLYAYRVSAANIAGDGAKSVDRSAVPAAVRFGRPAWWDGVCDAGRWNPHAATLGWTGGAYELGASYLGIPVCGPRPGDNSAPTLPWNRTGPQQSEWDSAELAFRFMAQAYEVTPYAAVPENVVRSYTPASGGSLVAIDNTGAAGVVPLPGDIISFDSQTTTGNVVVVATTDVDASGNGTLTVLSQNDTPSGWRTIQVTTWVVRGFGVSGQPGQNVPYGWLHAAAGVTGRPLTGRVTIAAPTDTGPRPATPDPPAATGRPPAPPSHGG
jgi:fibronectin type 3 domain-containing protein